MAIGGWEIGKLGDWAIGRLGGWEIGITGIGRLGDSYVLHEYWAAYLPTSQLPNPRTCVCVSVFVYVRV